MSENATPKKAPTLQSIAIAVLGVGSLEAESICNDVPSDRHSKIMEMYKASQTAETIRGEFFPAKEESKQQDAPVDPPQEKIKSGKSK